MIRLQLKETSSDQDFCGEVSTLQTDMIRLQLQDISVMEQDLRARYKF